MRAIVLFDARAQRVRPGRDDKVLADWNGLAIAALARAAAVFERPEWLARAAEAFDFVLAQMGAPDGRVQHAWRLGRVTAAGLLDDQAAMARAALALFEATGDARASGAGGAHRAATEAHFADGHGGFYTTADDATDVPLARPRTAADNATPAGAGMHRRGARPPVPPDRRRGVARAGRGGAARLHRSSNASPACRACWPPRICWRRPRRW